jgi:hypothetical protein
MRRQSADRPAASKPPTRRIHPILPRHSRIVGDSGSQHSCRQEAAGPDTVLPVQGVQQLNAASGKRFYSVVSEQVNASLVTSSSTHPAAQAA